MEAVIAALATCLVTIIAFFWDSLYGLIFGFLISAIVQVAFSRGALERALGPNLRGIATGALFGIVASACSYGAAAAARGFYAKGADLRAVFAFLISSTNMNVAIVIMFAAMLGWKFAFAEFFGGLIIIAVVVTGATWLLPRAALQSAEPEKASFSVPTRRCECLQCAMEDEGAHDRQAQGFARLRKRTGWSSVLATMRADVEMLRSEIVIGFSVAGCAAALIPPQWLSNALVMIGGVPFVGYPLLLLAGLLLAIITFVCSMGNVPIARFLAGTGIPLGANTAFVYGDLLIPPLVGIYRKSFPPRVVWVFLGFFVLGAVGAGAAMDAIFGRSAPTVLPMGMTAFSGRCTSIVNALALLALGCTVIVGRGRPQPP